MLQMMVMLTISSSSSPQAPVLWVPMLAPQEHLHTSYPSRLHEVCVFSPLGILQFPRSLGADATLGSLVYTVCSLKHFYLV